MFRGASLHLENPEYLQAARAFLEELLLEDTRPRDLTVAALRIGSERAAGQILAKQPGIIAGIAEYRWLLGRGGIAVKVLKKDGEAIARGEVLLEIEGERGALLSYERVGLNLLQRMSGIATVTHNLQERVRRRNPATSVVGTRKTPWGLLDKRALHLGGGGTHRLGLGDAILVKNNHLSLLASKEEEACANRRALRAWSLRESAVFIEVEVRSKAGAVAAAETFRELRDEDSAACPCWLLLDNIAPDEISLILRALRSDGLLDHVLIEGSGNISEANAEEYAASGVDAGSSGRADAFGESTGPFRKNSNEWSLSHDHSAYDVCRQRTCAARYALPLIEELTDTPEEIAEKQERVRELCAERNAILLAHHYQRPEVQEVADCVADSLRLSQTAAKTGADVIVFCGVHIMAETAAILCPDRTVLLPDLRAGCSLAAAVTAEELRIWKARFPDAVVVSYINTSAAVKAESDYCCTSANAAKVVRAIPCDRPIFFVADKCLAAGVERQAERSNIIAYPGYCHVHKTIRPEDVTALLDEHPDVELLLHPECGCVTSCMAKALDGSLPHNRTFFLSTEGMLTHIAKSPATEFAVGTESGILHRLRKENDGKSFYPVNPDAICAFMKTITLDRIIRSLETLSPRVKVPQEIARSRRGARSTACSS